MRSARLPNCTPPNFETLKKQMGAVNDKGIGLEALERDATVNRNLLEAMLLRAKQSTGAEDILTANAKLVSPASPAQAPSYPPKALLALLGVAGGMLVGVMIALLREGGDHTFRRADQIEALTGLPVLAMVPQVARRHQCQAARVGTTIARAPATAAGVSGKSSSRGSAGSGSAHRRRAAARPGRP